MRNTWGLIQFVVIISLSYYIACIRLSVDRQNYIKKNKNSFNCSRNVDPIYNNVSGWQNHTTMLVRNKIFGRLKQGIAFQYTYICFHVLPQ